MQATRTLPENYRPGGQLALAKPLPVLLMNAAALPILLVAGDVFLRLARALRREPAPPLLSGAGTGQVMLDSHQLIWIILLIVLAVVITIVIHELIHGVFFWLFTRSRPRFAFKGAYAYAAAPDWYIPRNQYLVIGLSPLALISLAGILILAMAPLPFFWYVYVAVAYNAAGAVGDMTVTAWVLTRPAAALVRDSGDDFSVYVPDEKPSSSS
jgi:hypothetical protein